MDRWVGKVAIVTGASAGIGKAIVEKLVEHGLIVVGLARRVDKLEILADSLKNKKGKFYPRKADVTNEEELKAAIKWASETLGPIHILINNAGVVKNNTLINGDTQKWKEVFDTNVLGLCIATREVIQDMLKHKIDGHIIHMNSIAGHFFGPGVGNNVYGASKFAVTNLTETLRHELLAAKSKIKISNVNPGVVATDILSDLPQHYIEWLKNAPRLNPEDIADGVVYILGTPPHVQVYDLTIKPVGEAL